MGLRVRGWSAFQILAAWVVGALVVIGLAAVSRSMPVSDRYVIDEKCEPNEVSDSCKRKTGDLARWLGDTVDLYKAKVVIEDRPLGDFASNALVLIALSLPFVLAGVSLWWLTGARQTVAIQARHAVQMSLLWVIALAVTFVLIAADLIPPFGDAEWDDVPALATFALGLVWAALLIATWKWAETRGHQQNSGG